MLAQCDGHIIRNIRLTVRGVTNNHNGHVITLTGYKPNNDVVVLRRWYSADQYSYGSTREHNRRVRDIFRLYQNLCECFDS